MMPWYKLLAVALLALLMMGIIDFLLWVEW